MKVISLTDFPDNAAHSPEDALCISKNKPVFAVADGVTLLQHLAEKESYPDPSPAGQLAALVCQTAVEAAEEHYADIGGEQSLRTVFRSANGAAKWFNQEHGRIPATVDFWRTDYYAATAAFLVLKDKTAYWATICDSFVAHFRGGRQLFMSPDCLAAKQAAGPPYSGDPSDVKAETSFKWRYRRNAVNSHNQLTGYGVVTGEETAERYLNTGQLAVQSGDLLLLGTDGFAPFIELPEFTRLLSRWPDDAETKLKDLSQAYARKNAAAYGSERTLIAVLV